VTIEETRLDDVAAGWVLRDAADVDDAQAAAVVGLVGQAGDGVLVVVDGLGGRLVIARVVGSEEVGDVEEVGLCPCQTHGHRKEDGEWRNLLWCG
jgi:hypothetical protein